MAQFIEIQSTGDKRFFVRASTIDRLELPPGADAETTLSDEAPAILHLRDGSQIRAYNKSPLQLLHAITISESPCVFLDAPEVDGG